MAEAQKQRRPELQPFRPGRKPARGTRSPFPDLRRNGRRQDAEISARRRGGATLQAGAWHIHAMGGPPIRHRPAVLRGLHGAVKTDKVDVARHADLLIGVVPIINLEWIQKLHRDRDARGQSQEAIVDTILRRMPDYVKYICPAVLLTRMSISSGCRRWTPPTRSYRATSQAPTRACSSSVSGIRRASTFLICSRCCTTRSCHAPTRSCAPAARWRWRCSSSSRQ